MLSLKEVILYGVHALGIVLNSTLTFLRRKAAHLPLMTEVFLLTSIESQVFFFSPLCDDSLLLIRNSILSPPNPWHPEYSSSYDDQNPTWQYAEFSLPCLTCPQLVGSFESYPVNSSNTMMKLGDDDDDDDDDWVT